MFKAVVTLFAASIVLAALALISCLSVEDRSRIRGMPRWAWILVILVAPILGPVAYFVWGRPLPEGGTRSSWLPGGPTSEPPRPRAPDDDPEFLRSLDQSFTAEDEEMLRRWEEDVKRREEEKRRRDRDS